MMISGMSFRRPVPRQSTVTVQGSRLSFTIRHTLRKPSQVSHAMRKAFVEEVGPAWVIRSGGPRSIEQGYRAGTVRVGSRLVAWKRVAGAPFVEVNHSPSAIAFNKSQMGVNTSLVAYKVYLANSVMVSGGLRQWWACPVCCRRCRLLYLPWDQTRVACRLCCDLVFQSQYRTWLLHAECRISTRKRVARAIRIVVPGLVILNLDASHSPFAERVHGDRAAMTGRSRIPSP